MRRSFCQGEILTWVRAEALSVVGVAVPDVDAGEIAAGAIVVAEVVVRFDMTQCRFNQRDDQ